MIDEYFRELEVYDIDEWFLLHFKMLDKSYIREGGSYYSVVQLYHGLDKVLLKYNGNLWKYHLSDLDVNKYVAIQNYRKQCEFSDVYPYYNYLCVPLEEVDSDDLKDDVRIEDMIEKWQVKE